MVSWKRERLSQVLDSFAKTDKNIPALTVKSIDWIAKVRAGLLHCINVIYAPSSALYSRMSPGWQSNALQSASRVEKRTARALPVFKIDRFAAEIPTFSANSEEVIFLLANITSTLTIIGITILLLMFSLVLRHLCLYLWGMTEGSFPPCWKGLQEEERISSFRKWSSRWKWSHLVCHCRPKR